MEDEVNFTLDEQIVCNVVLDEPESGISRKMGDVLGASGYQVVNADHSMAFCNEPIAEMRTKESGAAGDY